MSKTSKIVLGLLVLCTFTSFFQSFDVQPEVHLWNWFGYQFGFTITSHLLPLKIISLVLIGFLIYDNKFKKRLA